VADFYLDEDVPNLLVSLLAGLGHPALSTRRAGNARAWDDEQLLFTSREERIFVTHNYRDYELLHSAWLRWSVAWGVAQQHPGILVIPQPPELSPLQAAHELSNFVSAGRPVRN
jgi:hypothetical protein